MSKKIRLRNGQDKQGALSHAFTFMKKVYNHL